MKMVYQLLLYNIKPFQKRTPNITFLMLYLVFAGNKNCNFPRENISFRRGNNSFIMDHGTPKLGQLT